MSEDRSGMEAARLARRHETREARAVRKAAFIAGWQQCAEEVAETLEAIGHPVSPLACAAIARDAAHLVEPKANRWVAREIGSRDPA